jgi:hypothetical protein
MLWLVHNNGGEVGAGQSLAAVGGKIDALDLDPPAARLEHPEDHVDRGRLAGPVRTEQADDLAGRDVKADAVHGPHVAERLFQALDLEDGRRGPIHLPAGIRQSAGAHP